MIHSLRCCTPTAYDARSRKLVHGYLCHKAGKPLNDDEYAEWVASRPRHPAGTARLEERLNASTPLRTWFSHDPGCECPDCAYVNHHSDDNDDRTLEPVAGEREDRMTDGYVRGRAGSAGRCGMSRSSQEAEDIFALPQREHLHRLRRRTALRGRDDT